MSDPSPDPMEFLRNLWGNLGVPLPGMAVPTLDTGELDKRIADLKAVEGWLKMNLNMLQMSIQAMETQRTTLGAFQAMSQGGAASDKGAEPGPFANPALWPWNFMPTDNNSGATPSTSPPKADKKKE